MACNPAISCFKWRIDIIEGRSDITDQEVVDFMGIQLAAMLRGGFERCWVDGATTGRLVARGVPTAEDLDGDKLVKAMSEENKEIMGNSGSNTLGREDAQKDAQKDREKDIVNGPNIFFSNQVQVPTWQAANHLSFFNEITDITGT